MPFEGQNVEKPQTKAVDKTIKSSPAPSNLNQPVQRQQQTKPSGNVEINTLGINAILNPPKVESEKELQAKKDNLPIENFTNEQFLRAWKAFSLKVKREKKDSLFSTMVNGKPQLDSELNINLTLSSKMAAKEIEAVKPELLKFLRAKLNNYQINLKYKINKVAKTEFQDSKAKFKKLSEENPSLEKLRKLFNLDIEY